MINPFAPMVRGNKLRCHCGAYWPASWICTWLRHIYRCTRTVLEYPISKERA